MKKLLLILLCLPLLFTTCKKEDDNIIGCTDPLANNYNPLANADGVPCIYTKAVIIVTDGPLSKVTNARVVLHANSLKQPLYAYNPDNYNSLDDLVKYNLDTLYSQTGQTSNVFNAESTDSNGRVEFTFPLEMVLNISVLKIDENDEYLGANIIQLRKGVTETKIVEINKQLR